MNFFFSDAVQKFLLVMLGGGTGSMCRYATTLMAAKYFGTRFPYGTMIANLSGCFLIGVCFELADRSAWFGTSARVFFMTGFLGGLTTFSSFALETVVAERRGTDPVALINFFVNNVIGMAMVLAGIWLVGYFFKGRA